MCGRYNLRSPISVLAKQFRADLQATFDWEPRYNIPPTAKIPAVRLNEGKRELALLGTDWELVQIAIRATSAAFKTGNPFQGNGHHLRAPPTKPGN